eukprot:Phypoly_transcript_18691.p1 GENE.Phypoly_transcript_18691~~Phypoly_transcript_18691.p1  ORF type:complete len:204 (+),score=36.72 Phypoly_transcript_18691:87-698(+)
MDIIEELAADRVVGALNAHADSTVNFTSFKKSLRSRRKAQDAADEEGSDTRFQKRMKRERMITAREKKKLKTFHLSKKGHKYVNYVPLHQLWSQYISSIVDQNLPNEACQTKLLKADFHGAIITVEKSKCPTVIGMSGILIQETENTMKIVTKEDELKVLPKRGTIFSFNIHNKRVEIYGNHILYRSSERAVKKFKGRQTIEL